MSNIAIIDDEIEINEILSEYLKSFGHHVVSFSDPNEALSSLDKSPEIELVISDIKMPQMTGIDLFQKYRSKENNKARFILMTGHIDLMNAQLAYSLGAEELLTKPFDFDILKLVVNYLLESDESFGNQNDKYFPIPVDDLMVSSQTQYNLYLKINNKFVCVNKTGQEFTALRLQNLEQKGVKYIYLTSSDYAKYTDIQFALASTMKMRPIENAKKTKAFNHLISTVSNNAIINQMDKNSLNKAIEAFECYTQLAFNNSQMAEMLITISKESPDLAEKSSLVSAISSSVADLWKWNSPKIQSRIVLGALLCDIGLKDYIELQNKKRMQFTKEELVLFEEHPMRSYKMLCEIGDLPDEILQITLQHHENGIGAGFPQKLIRSKVHSFSKLVHGVSEFVDTLYYQKDKGNVKLALDHIFALQRKIVSEQVLKSLYMVFNQPVPRELEGLLLPDKSGRLA